MSVKDSKTELLIKDTATRIFLAEGKWQATTQEIADAAGVNRTLLHYYFRSRDQLFNLVFTEALTGLREKLHQVICSELAFREKIEHLVQAFYEVLDKYPYLESFVAVHLNQKPDDYESLFITLPGGKERITNFLLQIEQEMDRGTIPRMKPVNYFMNLFALMAYPYVAKPIYLSLFDLDSNAFREILNERKSIIMSLLFK